MSQTFRDTTLLTAIRRDGYTCENARDTTPAAADLAAWRVECEDALVYWVGIDKEGRLSVSPTPLGNEPTLWILPVTPDVPAGSERPQRLDR